MSFFKIAIYFVLLFTQNISLCVEAGFCQIRSHMCKFSTNIFFADFEIACTYSLQKLNLLNQSTSIPVYRKYNTRDVLRC